MLCSDLEECDEGGREAQEGDNLCTHIADSFLLHGRSQHNIVKQLYSNFFKKSILQIHGVGGNHGDHWSTQQMMSPLDILFHPQLLVYVQ